MAVAVVITSSLRHEVRRKTSIRRRFHQADAPIPASTPPARASFVLAFDDVCIRRAFLISL